MKSRLPHWSQRARRALVVALTTVFALGLVLALFGTTTGCVGNDCNGASKPSTASVQACVDCLNAGGGCPGGNNWSFEINKTCKCTSSGPGTPSFRSIVGPE